MLIEEIFYKSQTSKMIQALQVNFYDPTYICLFLETLVLFLPFLPLVAWDCSAWVRTYALFLEERLECFRVLKYDIESERLMRSPQGAPKVLWLFFFPDFMCCIKISL